MATPKFSVLLEDAYPDLYAKINFELSDDSQLHPKLGYKKFTIGGKSKLAWNWECGHVTFQIIKNVVKGYGCQICSGKEILVGFNDLKNKMESRLLAEFDFDKNTKTPEQILAGTNSKVWWKCNLDHSWQEAPGKRIFRGDNCPICSGRRVEAGFNDLRACFPEIAEEYDEDRNKTEFGLYSSEISKASNRKVWWICKNSGLQPHRWLSAVAMRTRDQANGCPICVGKNVLAGFNDLVTKDPILLSEWNYEKNKIDPAQVYYRTDTKHYWTCSFCGTERFAHTKETCQKCKKTSYLENCVELDLVKLDLHFLRNKYPLFYKKDANDRIIKWQIDFQLVDENNKPYLGIEVQDFATHSLTSDDVKYPTQYGGGLKKGPTYHAKKKELAKDQLSIDIIEIWEDEIKLGYSENIIFSALNS